MALVDAAVLVSRARSEDARVSPRNVSPRKKVADNPALAEHVGHKIILRRERQEQRRIFLLARERRKRAKAQRLEAKKRAAPPTLDTIAADPTLAKRLDPETARRFLYRTIIVQTALWPMLSRPDAPAPVEPTP